MRWTPAKAANERGTALVFAGVALAGVLASAALAVDAAMVFSARAEAQNAADAAALAGASAFVDGAEGDILDLAEARALDVAEQNRIRESPIDAAETEVWVDDAEGTVQVTIRRPALPTFFARAIGFASVPVAATATARATTATTAGCVKPWTPPDLERVQESPGSAGGTKRKGKGRSGASGGAAAGGSESGGNGSAPPRGYAYGQQVVLKGSSAGGESQAWVVPSDAGWSGECSTSAAAHTPPAYEANICGCNRMEIDLDVEYERVSGSPGGLDPHTRRGVEELLAQDPGARWDAARKAVVGSRYSPWQESPRVITVPLHDPTSSGTDLKFTRFVRVFLETEDGGDVSGRYVNAMRTVQLIE